MHPNPHTYVLGHENSTNTKKSTVEICTVYSHMWYATGNHPNLQKSSSHAQIPKHEWLQHPKASFATFEQFCNF